MQGFDLKAVFKSSSKQTTTHIETNNRVGKASITTQQNRGDLENFNYYDKLKQHHGQSRDSYIAEANKPKIINNIKKFAPNNSGSTKELVEVYESSRPQIGVSKHGRNNYSVGRCEVPKSLLRMGNQPTYDELMSNQILKTEPSKFKNEHNTSAGISKIMIESFQFFIKPKVEVSKIKEKRISRLRTALQLTLETQFELVPMHLAQDKVHSGKSLLKTVEIMKNYILSLKKNYESQFDQLNINYEKLKCEFQVSLAQGITLLKENTNLKGKTLDLITKLQSIYSKNSQDEHLFKVMFKIMLSDESAQAHCREQIFEAFDSQLNFDGR